VLLSLFEDMVEATRDESGSMVLKAIAHLYLTRQLYHRIVVIAHIAIRGTIRLLLFPMTV